MTISDQLEQRMLRKRDREHAVRDVIFKALSRHLPRGFTVEKRDYFGLSMLTIRQGACGYTLKVKEAYHPREHLLNEDEPVVVKKTRAVVYQNGQVIPVLDGETLPPETPKNRIRQIRYADGSVWNPPTAEGAYQAG